MPLDEELEGIVELMEKEAAKGFSLKKISASLEKQGFDPEKIKRAAMIAGYDFEQPTLWKKIFFAPTGKNSKPVIAFSAVYFVFLLILFLAMNSLLKAYISISFSFWSSLALFLLFLVLGVAGYIASAFVMHFCAMIFVKDKSANNLRTALWLLLISFTASIYFMLVMYFLVHSKNPVILILVSYLVMFVFNIALIGFMYKINIGKAFLLSLIFSIALNVVSTVASFLFWLFVLAIFGVQFIAGPVFF